MLKKARMSEVSIQPRTRPQNVFTFFDRISKQICLLIHQFELYIALLSLVFIFKRICLLITYFSESLFNLPVSADIKRTRPNSGEISPPHPNSVSRLSWPELARVGPSSAEFGRIRPSIAEFSHQLGL